MKPLLVSFLLCASAVWAQKYNGPRPAKPDLPYLLHASRLLPTEAGTAIEEEKEEKVTYAVKGASSPVATPLAEPIFLLLSDKLAPEKFTLYRMEVKDGRRVISFNSRKPKDNPRPFNLALRQLDKGLYRIEANEGLENGEYCLSPQGANDVFCFRVE